MISDCIELVILADGEVQTELADGTVLLNEGTRFGIRLINYGQQRALAQVMIGDENVGAPGGYILFAMSPTDIFRPVAKDVAFVFSGTAVVNVRVYKEAASSYYCMPGMPLPVVGPPMGGAIYLDDDGIQPVETCYGDVDGPNETGQKSVPVVINVAGLPINLRVVLRRLPSK